MKHVSLIAFSIGAALSCPGSVSFAYAQDNYAHELASCNKWVQGMEDMQRRAGHNPAPTDPAVCQAIALRAVAIARSCAGLGPAPGDPPFPEDCKMPSPAEYCYACGCVPPIVVTPPQRVLWKAAYMKFQAGDAVDTALCVAIKHEFLRCDDALNDFVLSATTMITQGEHPRIAYKTYNAYARFIHHLYEFMLGAVARDRGTPRN